MVTVTLSPAIDVTVAVNPVKLQYGVADLLQCRAARNVESVASIGPEVRRERFRYRPRARFRKRRLGKPGFRRRL